MQSVLGEPNTFESSLNKEGESLDNKKTNCGADLSSDYHIYGIERRKELIRIYFDGNIVWEYEIKANPELYTKSLPLTLSISGTKDVQPDDMKLPAYLMIDYVKVYKAVNNGAIIPTYGENVVVNPGFESAIGDDRPEGWTVTKTSGKSVVWVFRDSHGNKGSKSRFHFGKDHEPSTFDYTLSQKLTNIPDGLYRLEVWAYMVEGKSPLDPNPYLFARGHATSEKKILIEAIGGHYDHNSYRRYIIDNIYVKGGACEIGVRAVSNSNGLYSIFVDDFSLTKVNY
jgi:Glycosyl hydrolases family 16.